MATIRDSRREEQASRSSGVMCDSFGWSSGTDAHEAQWSCIHAPVRSPRTWLVSDMFSTSLMHSLVPIDLFFLLIGWGHGQRELLTKSWIYGISMTQVQALMKPHIAVDGNGEKLLMDPVNKPNFPSAATCDLPKSETWQLACTKRCNPGVMRTQAVEEREGILSTFQYEPGD